MVERYRLQAESDAKKSDSTLQVGLDMDKLMENQRFAMEENLKVFGTETPEMFTGMRTAKGDMLVAKAHMAARDIIKKAFPNIKVGLTLSLHDIQSVEGGEERAAKAWDEEFLHYLPYIHEDDFLGVQNYSRSIFGPDGLMPIPDGAEITQMNYEYYPEGLENVIRSVSKNFKKELLITENGIATDDDTRRVAYIKTATEGVKNCIEDGISVNGYFYWSLLDNFEWQKGYGMTFGLIAVDRSTQRRIPKEALRI